MKKDEARLVENPDFSRLREPKAFKNVRFNGRYFRKRMREIRRQMHTT